MSFFFVLCVFVLFFFVFLSLQSWWVHTGILEQLRPSAQTRSIPRQSGWVLIIPYRRSGHSKPTTVPSRSNQELVLKRLWWSALHSPLGGVCCILRQTFTHFVCKSLDRAAQQYGRGRLHSTSSQLPGTREPEQASKSRLHQSKAGHSSLTVRDERSDCCLETLYAMHY